MSEFPNGFEHEIKLEDFFTAYYDCRKNKRNTNSQLQFELNYEKNLVDLYYEVNSKHYKIGTSICFCVTKPKLREVFAANFRDRVIHHLVINKLNPLFERDFIVDTYNCRKGKGVLFGIQQLYAKIDTFTQHYKHNYWVGKFDIKSFFPSIDNNLLNSLLKAYIQENYHYNDKDILLYLVELIVLHSPQHNCIKYGNKMLFDNLEANKTLFKCQIFKGIAIGNLTSQIFANFFLMDFDKLMQDNFQYYGRYVDDFYVLAKTKKELKVAQEIALKYLSEQRKLELNLKKTYIQPIKYGVSFIGSSIKINRIYCVRRTIYNFKQLIKESNKKTSFDINEIIGYRQRINSYLGFLKHSRSFKIRYKLLTNLSEKFLQNILITKNYKVIKIRH